MVRTGRDLNWTRTTNARLAEGAERRRPVRQPRRRRTPAPARCARADARRMPTAPLSVHHAQPPAALPVVHRPQAAAKARDACRLRTGPVRSRGQLGLEHRDHSLAALAVVHPHAPHVAGEVTSINKRSQCRLAQQRGLQVEAEAVGQCGVHQVWRQHQLAETQRREEHL